jgi:hypothetical protein
MAQRALIPLPATTVILPVVSNRTHEFGARNLPQRPHPRNVRGGMAAAHFLIWEWPRVYRNPDGTSPTFR